MIGETDNRGIVVELTEGGREGSRKGGIYLFCSMVPMRERILVEGLEEYCRFAARRMLLSAINLLLLTGETLSLRNMRRIIGSMPRSMEEACDTEFQASSFCIKLLDRCCEDQSHVADEIGDYFFGEVTCMPRRIRSLIIGSLNWIEIDA